MGYSLCMMADFQNSLICRIFGVLWSSFFQVCFGPVSGVFWNFNFCVLEF